jgi:hypothetical protein
MLLPPTARSSRSGRSTRFGRERRHIRKLATVCRILGVLCAIAAVLFLISSFFVKTGMKTETVIQAQRKTSLIFLAVTPLLLIAGAGLDWWKHRFYGRGQKRRPPPPPDGTGEAGGNNNGPEVPRAEQPPAP